MSRQPLKTCLIVDVDFSTAPNTEGGETKDKQIPPEVCSFPKMKEGGQLSQKAPSLTLWFQNTFHPPTIPPLQCKGQPPMSFLSCFAHDSFFQVKKDSSCQPGQTHMSLSVVRFRKSHITSECWVQQLSKNSAGTYRLIMEVTCKIIFCPSTFFCKSRVFCIHFFPLSSHYCQSGT